MNPSICPCCSKSFISKPLTYGGYHYDNRDMSLVRCPKCSLTFVEHGLSDKNIDAFYNIDQYFESEYAGGAVRSYEDSKIPQIEKADFALRKIQKFMNGNKLLEIGCAGGYFLDYGRKSFGLEPWGIEISEKMCAFGKNVLGLRMHCGSVNDAPKDWNNFDIVYMGDVIEHVPHPNVFLGDIKDRMKVGGIVVIEVPLTYNWTLSGIIIGLANMFRGRFGKKYFLPAQHRENYISKPPYHLLMFGRVSMKKFLENNNFEVVYMKIYEGKPKDKFTPKNKSGLYSLLKNFTHVLTTYLPQNIFGDRMLVIGRKK